MAYRNSSFSIFKDIYTTGFDSVPINKVVLDKSSGNFYKKIINGNATTINEALTEGSCSKIPPIIIDSTSLNLSNKIVSRDASGNFSAGTITANLSGNATTATTANALNTANAYTGTSFNSITGLSSIVGSTLGVAAVGTATTAARADHVHPIQTSVTGNAGTANTLTTGRTIGMTGDVNWISSAFDGSSNVTGIATLSNSGVSAGTYGSSTNIPQIAINSKGIITGASNVAVSIPSGSISVTGDLTMSGNTGTTITNATLVNSGVSAGTYTKVTTDAKGRVTAGTTLSASDIPSLDASKLTSGTIDAARLPSYVDDVIEGATTSSFPTTGETGKIYVALDTNKTYRWGGSAYVYITSGAVDSVAGKTGVVTLVKGDVGLGSVDNTADSAKAVLSATKLATARTINGVSFDGTANITVADSTKLPLTGGTLTGSLSGTTCYFNSTNESTSTTTGAITTAGGIGAEKSIYAGGNVTAYSDSRLKTNIQVIPNALSKVCQLNGYTFDRIDMNLRQTGVIAQEVLKVLPEAISGSEDTIYGVAYGNMVGLLIEAIKELNLKIEILKEN